ncbi:MAG: FtsW/RodA/SpoVE family cell cycle protein, partial [Lachnospiraceae bacterium]|nr:FtsW/RodA/SpoVE family cell cycle protein [Lachnospiraceae bacterium]
ARIIGESTEGMIIKQFVQEDTFLIFAQVVAMYGFIAGAAVIAAFGAVVYSALHVVRRQKNQLGMILSAACFLLIVFNCTIGIFMNFGLLPMGSLQFPFLCRGGSGTVMYAVIIGLLMSCNRYSRIPVAHFDIKEKC